MYSADGCQGGCLHNGALGSPLHPHGQDGGAAAAKGHGYRMETVERIAGVELAQATAKAPLRTCYKALYTLLCWLRDRNPAPKYV